MFEHGSSDFSSVQFEFHGSEFNGYHEFHGSSKIMGFYFWNSLKSLFIFEFDFYLWTYNLEIFGEQYITLTLQWISDESKIFDLGLRRRSVTISGFVRKLTSSLVNILYVSYSELNDSACSIYLILIDIWMRFNGTLPCHTSTVVYHFRLWGS